MKVGLLYEITLGRYHDRYLCDKHDPVGYRMRRVRTAKSKIDAIRLPETIYISYFATPLNPEKQ